MELYDKIMTRQIPPQIISRIEGIPWFTKCNEPFDLKFAYPTRQVLNWKRAEVHWNRRSWEDAHADASNILTGYLSVNFPADYALWNDLVRSAKRYMQDVFYPAIETFAQQNSLARSFISNVEWDILGAILEETYLDCNLPVTFSSDLLMVYEAGHMPCGWEHADWPTGTLIVY